MERLGSVRIRYRFDGCGTVFGKSMDVCDVNETALESGSAWLDSGVDRNECKKSMRVCDVNEMATVKRPECGHKEACRNSIWYMVSSVQDDVK